MIKISFVIPCYRSEETIIAVLDEIRDICELFDDDYEIILINDASPDNVWNVIMSYAKENTNLAITAIDLAKNKGKHAALMAGFRECKGDIVVCLDDDGQSPVNNLLELLQPLENGFDVSVARYGRKKESIQKWLGSILNNWMANVLLDKPKDFQFGNFIAMRRFIVDEIIKYQNPYPYINGLYLQAGGRIANVPMEERERMVGMGGYTFYKSVSLFLNGMTSFSVKPLRIVSYFGLISSALGFIMLMVILVRKLLLNSIALAGYSSLIACVLFMGGVILLSLGMIGEYLGRMYICINNAPQYVIRDVYRNMEDKPCK